MSATDHQNRYRGITASIATRCLLFTVLPLSFSVQSQNLDDCMKAAPAQALAICQALVDSGRGDADVYWKLASALHQRNRTDEAIELLEEARRRHPDDLDLRTLERVVKSEQTEAQRLSAASERNSSRVSLGLLKIDCLTRSDNQGLDACRRYLDQTSEDGDRIEERLARLQTTLRPSPSDVATGTPSAETRRPAPAPPDTRDGMEPSRPDVATARVEPVPPDVDGVPPTTRSPAPIDPAPNSRASIDRQSVVESQQLLTELGFDPGPADGVPGRRTQDALERFYQRVAGPPRAEFGARVLADLRSARERLFVARALLQDSLTALEANDTERARQLHRQARTASPFLAIPDNLVARLETGPVVDAGTDPPAGPPGTAPGVRSPDPSSNASSDGRTVAGYDSAADDRRAEVTALLQRIRRLEDQLERSRDHRNRDLRATRDGTSAALARAR